MSFRPSHHPTPDDLLAYVTGEAGPTARAMVEGHLALCDACAGESGRQAAAGGRLLRALPVTAAPEALLARILDRLPDPPEGAAEVPLPGFLKALLPPPSERAWGGLGKGIRLLKLLKEKGAELFLLQLGPGAQFPHHGHRGPEWALLLEGDVDVAGVSYATGDWASFAPGTCHAPVAGPEGCWLLVRVEGGVKLSGWRGWLQRVLG